MKAAAVVLALLGVGWGVYAALDQLPAAAPRTTHPATPDVATRPAPIAAGPALAAAAASATSSPASGRVESAARNHRELLKIAGR